MTTDWRAFDGAASDTRSPARSSRSPSTMTWPGAQTELLGRAVVLTPWGLANVQAAIVKVVLGRPRPLAGDRAGYDETGVCLQQEVALWRSPKMRELWSVVHRPRASTSRC